MKSQNILLLLAILAVLARDVTCKKDVSEADEDEPDEDEPDEHEKENKHTKNMATASHSSASSVWTSVTPTRVSAIWPATSALLPTGAAAASESASVASEWTSAASDVAAVASDVAAAQTAIPSWATSVMYAPSATTRVSRNVPLATASVYRPYAGPGVVSGSNHVEISIGIVTIGILAFLMTLV